MELVIKDKRNIKNKIIVIGESAGVGKSLISRIIHERLGLPIISLDTAITFIKLKKLGQFPNLPKDVQVSFINRSVDQYKKIKENPNYATYLKHDDEYYIKLLEKDIEEFFSSFEYYNKTLDMKKLSEISFDADKKRFKDEIKNRKLLEEILKEVSSPTIIDCNAYIKNTNLHGVDGKVIGVYKFRPKSDPINVDVCIETHDLFKEKPKVVFDHPRDVINFVNLDIKRGLVRPEKIEEIDRLLKF